jgi:hypothetical protein
MKGPLEVIVTKTSTRSIESARHVEYSFSNSDHWNLVRFEHSQDERYISFIKKLGKMAEEVTKPLLVHRSYRDISTSSQARVHIGDVYVQHHSEQAESYLPFASNAPFDALHRQYESDCLPGTRVDVLASIYKWVDGEDDRCIFWLSGWPGTGKSAIARTVARRYHAEGRLAASFFFSTGGGDCSHAGLFVTSIARQLANNKALNIRQPIYESLKHSEITQQTLRDQWCQLVLQPLSSYEYEDKEAPRAFVLVVDALDECEGGRSIEALLEILPMVDQLAHIRLRILVTSRPETPIRHGFARMHTGTHQDFVLHLIPNESSDRDIMMFFEHRFRMIATEFNLDSDWPGQQILMAMTQRAQGHFIWATTACRFIEQEGREFADKRLQVLIQSRRSSTRDGPENLLDQIYTTALRGSVPGTLDQDEEKTAYTILSLILGTVAILFEALSVHSLSAMIDVSEDVVFRTVDNLHSILVVPETARGQLRLHHDSFRDFLLSNRIDSRLRVKEGDAHSGLSGRCIQVMSQILEENICKVSVSGTLLGEIPRDRIKDCLPPEAQYACLHWIQHIVQASQAGRRLLDGSMINVFLDKHILHWIEAMSWMGKTSDAIEAIASLEEMIQVSIGSNFPL